MSWQIMIRFKASTINTSFIASFLMDLLLELSILVQYKEILNAGISFQYILSATQLRSFHLPFRKYLPNYLRDQIMCQNIISQNVIIGIV
ncbi:hypothetical protein RhiirA4_39851 [Rhizophagus irregularis]|uniref:Uncharacterized protein n=1 Tax=Rhizophagus irregularis TaxID=588596 RepID=A0A2I1G3M0_9GLOM|nr:hypothetical protein RhiirA4_39851 [Rhizophagus irregularis]